LTLIDLDSEANFVNYKRNLALAVNEDDLNSAGNRTDTVRVETSTAPVTSHPLTSISLSSAVRLRFLAGAASEQARNSKPLRKKLEVRRVAAGRKGH
jgi:hypothetical protein